MGIFPFHLQSNIFLMVFAILSKQGFCSISTLNCTSIFPMQLFNLSVTIPKAPVTNGVTSTFFSFYYWPTSYFNTSHLFCFSSSFFLIRVSIIWHFPVFFLTTVIPSRMFSNFFSVCMGKSHKNLHSFDSSTFTGLFSYHLSAFTNTHFLQSFQWITLATLSYLVFLYSIRTNLGHFNAICVTVSSFSNSLHIGDTLSLNTLFRIHVFFTSSKLLSV